MGRLELLFTSLINSLQPRRNVQSSHVKGFNKARGMLLVIGVGHREAKSYKAQLPCGAFIVFLGIICLLLHSLHVLFSLHFLMSFLSSSGGWCEARRPSRLAFQLIKFLESRDDGVRVVLRSLADGLLGGQEMNALVHCCNCFSWGRFWFLSRFLLLCKKGVRLD